MNDDSDIFPVKPGRLVGMLEGGGMYGGVST